MPGWKLVPPIFFFSAVQSIQNAWSSFLPFLLRIDSRCDKRSRGSSGDQRQSSSFLSSGKPDDLLQSDNVNSYPTTAGIMGVWNKTWRILLQDKCRDSNQCKLCSFTFSFFFFFLPFYPWEQAFTRAKIKANKLHGRMIFFNYFFSMQALKLLERKVYVFSTLITDKGHLMAQENGISYSNRLWYILCGVIFL